MALSGDFLQGFAQNQLGPTGYLGGQLEDQAQRRQKKLELAMQSKKIEMELAAKQMAPNVSGAIAGNAGLQLNPGQTLTPEEGGALNSMFRAQTALSAKMRPRPPQYRAVGNEIMAIQWDPMTNTFKQTPMGIAPQFKAKAAEAVGNYAAADATLDEIEKFTEPLLTNGNFISTLPNGVKTQLSALAQTDPLARTYLDMRKKFAIDLTAVTYGKQMTEPEQKAILNALPDEYDSLETAALKMQTFRNIYDSTKNKHVEAYLGKATVNSLFDNQDNKNNKKGASDKARNAAREALKGL